MAIGVPLRLFAAARTLNVPAGCNRRQGLAVGLQSGHHWVSGRLRAAPPDFGEAIWEVTNVTRRN